MLLLDTSGSMAYTTVRDSENPSRYAMPRCGADAKDRYPTSGDVSFDATGFTAEASPADRWGILVNAFTGTIQGPQCAAQDRSSEAFLEEFGLGDTPSLSLAPYDKGYYLPYNRVVATGTLEGETEVRRCVPAPSWDTAVRNVTNAIAWPDVAPVYWRELADDKPFDPGTACPFEPQDTNGIIDRLQSAVRFGLMTFDPTPRRTDNQEIGTGISSLAPYYPSGIADTWSYFPGWLTYTSGGTGPMTGWPNDCLTDDENLRWYEVGARNAAAPPWEGRLIGFGDPQATTEEMIVHNERVQQAILGMRPFGGTPVLGMLADAYHFLTTDNTTPSDVGNADFYGGAVDSNVWMQDRTERGCRRRIAILITDGGPNLDLRPHCDPEYGTPQDDGKCPYDSWDSPADVARDLYDHNIDLFVVGFAVTAAGDGPPLTCSQLMDPNDDAHRPCEGVGGLVRCDAGCGSLACAYGYCISDAEDELLAVCCNLEDIANEGSRYTDADEGMTAGAPRSAYFAESGADLLAAISNILRFPSAAMTRTQPVFATGNASATNLGGDMVGARFFSSFDPIADDLYAGHLVRERYACEPADEEEPGLGLVATEQDIDQDQGDYFEVNVDTVPDSRAFYTVVAEAETVGTNQVIRSKRSVRPLHAPLGDDTDGLGTTGGSTATGSRTTFPGEVPPSALFEENQCTSTEPLCCPRISPTSVPDASECRNRILKLQLGYSATQVGDSASEYVRASTFGAMINSTPELVLAPGEYLRDESYTRFQNLFAERPPMIYAATADGQLHAFKINQLNSQLNELWSFMPPAVLPSIGDQFPTRFAAANKTLLSGPLVVTEVSGRAPAEEGVDRFLTREAPVAGEVDDSQWYSILLGTYGTTGGYYALDITNPEPTKTVEDYTSGPRFLWQLTTDAEGNPLFGERSTRPAIATLYFVMPGSGNTDPAQHAVAILPGGYGGVRSTTSLEETVFPTGSVADMDVQHRTQTAAYAPVSTSMRDKLSLAGARSLTIVRLDTGEVIRTFRRSDQYDSNNPEAPEGLYTKGRVTEAPFAAPLVGNIVSYPNTPGSVADRAFIGDAEGRLWRIDLSSAEPEDWSVTLFHDAYPVTGLGALPEDAETGEPTLFDLEDIGPIETPPIISTDPLGRLTIAISTGEQTSLTPKGRHSVWSLTEWREAGELVSHVNWFLNGTNAKNLSGDARDKLDHFADGTGERVTGPMALFSSVLYFTTYNPGSLDSGACSPGDSYLWGVHYLQSGTTGGTVTDTPTDGPMPQFSDPESEATASMDDYVRVIPIAPGGIAFGVGVMQKPSCMVTDSGDDPFLGLSNHQTIQSVNPGAFQLIVQVGANEGAGDKKVRVDTFDLMPPSARSIIDSWAAILD
jgi:type IV pilus assembly protein PilY1